MTKQLSLHGFIKNTAMALAVVAMAGLLHTGKVAQAEEHDKKPAKGKIMIVYFSHSGNTRHLASQIHERIEGDMLEIKTVNTYSDDYNTVVEQAKQEQKTNARPKLATMIPDLSYYDTIFVGYPNWWGTMPMALFTFFEGNNFQGKTIIPFVTHEGSGLGRSVSDLKKLNPRSTLLDGLAIRGRSVKDSSTQKAIDKWLADLNISAVKAK